MRGKITWTHWEGGYAIIWYPPSFYAPDGCAALPGYKILRKGMTFDEACHALDVIYED